MTYWGKASAFEEDGRWHRLEFHALDVAAVAERLIETDDTTRRFLAAAAGLPETTVAGLVPALMALHDLGKFAGAFQSRVPKLLARLQPGCLPRTSPLRHDSLGWLLWRWRLRADPGVRDCLGGRRGTRALEPWLAAIFGHHGEPPRDDDEQAIHDAFADPDIAAATAFARDALVLYLRSGVTVTADLRPSSWLIAGLAVLADWIGSNRAWFPYKAEGLLREYYPEALKRAGAALALAGVRRAPSSTTTGLRKLFPEIVASRPLQARAEAAPLGKGPQLFVIEDMTGAGKTEAALVLAHRLTAERGARGLYFALPTMATANAMYRRMAEVFPRLFADPTDASLILAHGRNDLVRAFRLSVLPIGATVSPLMGEPEGAVQCAAWIADNRKKAFLADLGVGTVDQALAAVLHARHQSLRLYGLAGGVLIVDEVHAYDPYMLALLKTLLTFQAGLGGHAVLLSATLPLATRRDLIDAFRTGLDREPRPDEVGAAYPILIHADAEAGGQGMAVEASSRRKPVQIVPLRTEDEVAERLCAAAKDGRCGVWVRNTVEDARRGHAMLRARLGEKAELFHARFVLGDRLERENDVLGRYGKDSGAEERRGRVLVATQVVEQSLDLDFDVMACDLAPIDLVIQRAGRLHRHARLADGRLRQDGGEDERGEAMLWLLGPEPTPKADERWYSRALPRAAHVYKDHGRLWLTASALAAHGVIALPDNLRVLIEAVYGPDAGADAPEPLRRLSEKVEGVAMGDVSSASWNALRFGKGYVRGDATSPWEDDRRAPTRLGERSTTLRLARLGDGRLEPMAEGDGFEAWRMSEVEVREGLLGEGAVDRGPAADVIERVRQSWPDGGKWSTTAAMSFGRDGAWHGVLTRPDGSTVTLRYDTAEGLAVTR